MWKTVKYWLLLTFCSLGFTAHGAVINDLFTASVEVQSQSESAQKTALKQAITDVLIKVSGTKSLLSNDQIKRQIRNPNNFLQSYRFDFSKPNKTLYVADFNPQKIENAIRSAGFPVWGKRRPDTLLWLALENKQTKQRTLIGETDNPTITTTALQTAKARGIVIDFPILDLTDLQRLNVYDVWGSYAQRITGASERYDADIVMSARIYYQDDSTPSHYDLTESEDSTSRDELSESSSADIDGSLNLLDQDNSPVDGVTSEVLNDQKEKVVFQPPQVTKINVWIGQWLLRHRGEVVSGQVDGQTVESVIQQLVDSLADKQAEFYAIDVSQLSLDERQAEIKVDNIHNLTDYQQVTDLLSGLTVVTKATLVEIQGQQGIYHMELLGSAADLLDSLNLDNRIKAKTDQFGQVDDPLHFVWRK